MTTSNYHRSNIQFMRYKSMGVDCRQTNTMRYCTIVAFLGLMSFKWCSVYTY